MKPKPTTIFKMLGDDTRYRIIKCLIDGERCACAIPKLVKRAQPTVSLQLKKLVKAGILSSRREGRWMKYSIRDKRILYLIWYVE
ncbi:MAG: metalloregulator ArsR/SmtB family transcription factor [Candidatus Micrarchaeia archaeon]